MAISASDTIDGRLAYLRVASTDGVLETELTIGAARMQFASRQLDTSKRPTADVPGTSPEAVEQASVAGFVAEVLDPELRRVLEQWSMRQADDPVLIVNAVDDVGAGLPWELLPTGLRTPRMFVVRAPDLDLDIEDYDGDWLKASGVEQPRPTDIMVLGDESPTTVGDVDVAESERRLFVAGWPGILAHGLFEGLERELRELTRFRGSEGFEIAAWTDPTKAQLFREIESASPQLLHLSPMGMDGPFRFPVAPASPSQPDHESVDVDELSELLEALPDLALFVLNTQDSRAMAIELGKRLGITALGWDGPLEDQMASDWAVHLYERVAEGMPPFRGSRRFVRRFATYQTIHGARPIAWIPDVSALDTQVVAPVPVQDLGADAVRGKDGFMPATRRERAVEIVFDPQKSLFPSLLKNGRAAIERLNITSNIEGTVHVDVLCDTGAGTSIYGETRELHFGDNRFEPEDIVFPILYELMDSDARRRVNLQVTVSADDGTVLDQVTKAVAWRGRNEWLDQREAWPFVASFVQPMSDSVASISQQAHDILTEIGEEPNLSLNGYLSGDRELVDLQMRSIYQAVRQRSIKYITPPSSPVHSDLGSGQLVRFPDMVIERRHGTCHDLTLLFASVAEYVGIYPVVILIPGHTYLGYWRDPFEHQAYWTRVNSQTLRALTGLGADFMMTGTELNELADAGQLQLVEATDVTKPEITFKTSCRNGKANLAKGFDAAIDVWQSRRQIQTL